ncbi:hypothetical protein Tco_1391753 [Tanacetum coccineum]
MVNILVSGETYDKVFNHLHEPLEGKVQRIENKAKRYKEASRAMIGLVMKQSFIFEKSKMPLDLGFLLDDCLRGQ